MNEQDDRPVAVIGATGQQGGAVASALLDRGAVVRALVHNPDKADGLRDRGAEVVAVDLDDVDSIRDAVAGVAAVFAMTTMTGPDGTDGEIRQGRAIADAARDAGVPHLVYSSVGGAERHTGIPHFESKWAVEEYLRELAIPAVVIRPVFFMENFPSLFPPAEDDGTLVLRAPLAPGVPLQMVAVSDIGRAAATALLDPGAVDGAVEIAGDELTGEQVADVLAAARDLPGRFESLPVDAVGDDDAIAMFRWFTKLPAYQADFTATAALVGEPLDFAGFVATLPPGR